MLQRAEEKRAMQRMVISGDKSASSTDSFIRGDRGDQAKMTQSDMVSLLLDDEELARRLAQKKRAQTSRGRPGVKKAAAVGEQEGGASLSMPKTPSVESILNRKRMAAWAERVSSLPPPLFDQPIDVLYCKFSPLFSVPWWRRWPRQEITCCGMKKQQPPHTARSLAC